MVSPRVKLNKKATIDRRFLGKSMLQVMSAASWGLWGPVGGGVSNVSNGPIPEIPRCEKKPELHVTAPMVSGVKTESWLLGEAGRG